MYWKQTHFLISSANLHLPDLRATAARALNILAHSLSHGVKAPALGMSSGMDVLWGWPNGVTRRATHRSAPSFLAAVSCDP